MSHTLKIYSNNDSTPHWVKPSSQNMIAFFKLNLSWILFQYTLHSCTSRVIRMMIETCQIYLLLPMPTSMLILLPPMQGLSPLDFLSLHSLMLLSVIYALVTGPSRTTLLPTSGTLRLIFHFANMSSSPALGHPLMILTGTFWVDNVLGTLTTCTSV